jgi:hypothetical protein
MFTFKIAVFIVVLIASISIIGVDPKSNGDVLKYRSWDSERGEKRVSSKYHDYH